MREGAREGGRGREGKREGGREGGHDLATPRQDPAIILCMMPFLAEERGSEGGKDVFV